MNKKKRVLFLIDGLPGGGAEKVVVTLSGGLASLGHDVTIISLSEKCDYEIPSDVRLLFSLDGYRGPFHRLGEIKRRANKLDELIIEQFGDEGFDLIVSNLPKTDRVIAASKTLRDAWMCIHNAVSLNLRAKSNVLKMWLKKRRLVNLYSGRKLIAVSEGVKEGILEFGIKPSRIECIYNPFDVSLIRSLSKEDCPLEGEKFLLHVGRYNLQKRHDRLFEAVKLSGYQGKLVCLGQGSEEEKCRVFDACKRAGLDGRVVFPGFTKNPYPYMRCAEALVLSSDYEGFGNVIVESLICGTPVASVRCKYGPEEILTGELSIGLSDVDALALSKSIQKILAKGRNDKCWDGGHFCIDKICNRYISLVG